MLNSTYIAVLRRHLRHLPLAEAIAPGLPLGELGLDSMAVVALLVDLEQEFGVTLPDASLRPETFASVSSLWTEFDRAIALRR